jgi:hypothetical protein
LIRLLDASLSPVAKNVHGSIPAKTMSGYGAVPSGGSLAMRPKTTVKTTIVRSGRITAQGHPDHAPLVAHREIAPSEDTKQFTIAPQIKPIVELVLARFD